MGVSRDCPIFWIPPIMSGTGYAKNFKFCTHIHSIVRNKSPLKISGKVTVGLLRDSRKFSGHVPIYRAHRAVIFAIARLSCLRTDGMAPFRTYLWNCENFGLLSLSLLVSWRALTSWIRRPISSHLVSHRACSDAGRRLYRVFHGGLMNSAA